jgi:hypothetical protein
MDYFPQLATGAMGQFPLRRTRRTRTVVNSATDGRRVKLADSGAGVTEWVLEYRELSDGEVEAVTAFHQAVEGRLRTFTFLDPAANLLAWSEKLSEPVWEKGPLVNVSGGEADPSGGTGAWLVTNAGPTAAGVAQTLNVPGWFRYSLSAYVRSAQNAEVALVCGGGRATRRLSGEWRRLVLACEPGTTAESARFGLEVAGGGSVTVYGMQVEPQIAASAYKRTGARGGVYTNARLASDALEVTATAAGRHSCRVEIIHGERF